MRFATWRRCLAWGVVGGLVGVGSAGACANGVEAGRMPCVFVSGGLGDDAPAPPADSPEALAARVWYDLDLQLTAQLQQVMVEQGYRIQPYAVPFADTATQRQTIHRQWQASGCDWLVQVAHTVGEREGQAYFGYDFTVALQQSRGRRVESLFNQRPRFVRDRDNLLNFRTREVVESFLRDVGSRRLLEGARTTVR